MSTAQIILLVTGVFLLVLFFGSFFYANLRTVPASGTAQEKNWIVRFSHWLFGVKGQKNKFDSPITALYYAPNTWVLNIFFTILIVGIILYMGADCNVVGNLSKMPAWEIFSAHFKEFFSINWELFFGFGSKMWIESVIYQIFQTVAIAFVGTFIAAILAIPFGILASHKLFGKWALISETILILIRTFPEVLLALVMVGFSGINPMTGVFALGIHSIGMIGKLYSEQIDEIDMTPLEAISASGGTSFQKITVGIMPQFLPSMISVDLYRFDINVRTATILGMVVGADCGIGFSINAAVAGGHYSDLGTCVLGVVILIIIIDLISTAIRKKMV